MANTGSFKTYQASHRSMTLSKIRKRGVHELKVLCRNPACRHQKTFNADDYADDIDLSWFGSRMICGRCGGCVDVRANSKQRLPKQADPAHPLRLLKRIASAA
jgi:hypothetical protein